MFAGWAALKCLMDLLIFWTKSDIFYQMRNKLNNIGSLWMLPVFLIYMFNLFNLNLELWNPDYTIIVMTDIICRAKLQVPSTDIIFKTTNFPQTSTRETIASKNHCEIFFGNEFFIPKIFVGFFQYLSIN